MNVELPLFGRSGTTQLTDGWADVDNFDVDLLAEYLLDDGAAAITWDFGVETSQGGSALVSPENSEDGNMPLLGEFHQANRSFLLPQTHGPGAAPTPAVATTFSLLSAQMPLQQPQAKRQRIEAPPVMAALASASCGAVATPMISEQQLAAAAQALQQGRGRKRSQVQVDRRRERNRVLARRTRLRKKFFFESLQKEVLDLQRENQRLKDLVKDHLDGEDSKRILDECDAMEKLPPSVLEALGETDGQMDSQDFNLVNSIQRSQHAFVITDPSLQDNPIVFASEDFLQVTGYTWEQVLGRNCRFLQGPETSVEKLETIRKALALGEDVSVTLLNYTADGTPFWNKLFIASLRDAQNNIVNFIAVIVKVASPSPDDPEHDKPLPEPLSNESAPPKDTGTAMEGAVASSTH